MAIKMFVSDVDGTLTDGMYHVSDNGAVSKSFFTRDFYAIGELIKKGVQVVAATSSNAGIISIKAMKLPYVLNIFAGLPDKKKAIEDFMAVWNITWDDVAYIGDAENDMECLQLAGLTCCPKDAIPEVREMVDLISDFNGGKGAVWDFANYVLELNEKEK